MIIQARLGCGPGHLPCCKGFQKKLQNCHNQQAWGFKLEDPSLVSIQAAIKELNDSKSLAWQLQRLTLRGWINQHHRWDPCAVFLHNGPYIVALWGSFCKSTNPIYKEGPMTPKVAPRNRNSIIMHMRFQHMTLEVTHYKRLVQTVQPRKSDRAKVQTQMPFWPALGP